MNKILDEVNARCGWDCLIGSFDGRCRCRSSGASTAHAQPLVRFNDVTYLSLPAEFSHPVFRIAAPDERAHVSTRVPLDADDAVIAIEAETMASLDRQVFFLVASSIELAPSTESSQ